MVIRRAVSYSARMSLTPPTFDMAPPRAKPRTRLYPDPETGLGRAWAAAWAELVTAGDFVDGMELAERTAPVGEVQPITMITLLTRAATAGVIERELRVMPSTRGARRRTFYRAIAK